MKKQSPPGPFAGPRALKTARPFQKVFTPFIITSILSVCVLFSFGSGAAPAEAAVADWQQGASIYPHNPDDFGTESFRESLRNLKATGANYAVLIVPIYQDYDSASEMHAGGDTPTDEALVSAIRYAHSIGLKVNLKPHLGSLSGAWRAYINASDRDAWFRNYGNYLNHLGDLGEANGVEGMTIGTELISMASYTSNGDNTERWNSLIADLRTHFSGFLTYSANWSWGSDNFEDEVKHIGFWPALDYIGISAYYPLASGQSDPSVQSMVDSWDYWNTQQIRALHTQYNKPILFTEVGYTSIDGAHNSPCCTWGGSFDETEQANDYEALFKYWDTQSYMAGTYLWNWDTNPNYGGQGNTDYTPQHKQAEQVMTRWWSGDGEPQDPGDDDPNDPNDPNDPQNPGGDDGENPGDNGGNDGGNTDPSSVSGEFSVSGDAPDLGVGREANLAVNVTNSGQASNVIVDVEIYDSSTRQVLQKFFEGENISSGGNHYDIPWTPAAEGTYTLKVGIFNQDWSHLYQWNDSVISLGVGVPADDGGNDGDGGDDGGEPSGPVETDLWWPTDGSRMAAVQPFKAMLKDDRSVSTYTMYWEVDGKGQNEMYNSDHDYPHKESWVDVGAWDWNGEGPYQVTFTSKDSSGAVVSEKTVNIYVDH